MKKTFIIAIIAFFIAATILVVMYYFKNFSGIGPAFQNAPIDITTVVPSSPQTQTQQTSSQQSTEQNATQQVVQNTTNMPLQLASGFSVSIFAKNLTNPRVLIKDPNGVLLTSDTAQGKIYALPDADHNGVADKNIAIVEGLKQPHGMAFQCPNPSDAKTCALYIGETDKVTGYLYDPTTLKATFDKKITDLSGGGRHFTRTLMFLNGADSNQLLVSIGSDCDVCHEENETRGTIQVLNVDTGELKLYARGLRNSVFMTYDPYFSKIYATEMGHDYLGDDTPPDEINMIEADKNYGWPNCYGQNIHDTEFDHNTYIRNPCMAPFETPAALDLQAHSAPLGLAFFPTADSINGQQNLWPQELRGNLLVSFHGSWNRSVPTGYKVVLIKTSQNSTDQTLSFSQPEDFMTGWLNKASNANGALGRPVDIFINPDRTIYISDDKAGVVYLLSYNG